MMSSAPQPSGTGPMSFADAARLDPDAEAGELDRGQWVALTKNTWRHGRIVVRVSVLLERYAGDHPGWSVSAGDPGTKLAHDPDVPRGPDVAMIRSEREPTGTGEAGWLDGAPDVAVEIAGDSLSASDLAKKALEYLAAGARVVWVLDAEPRRVMVFSPPDRVRILGPDDTLDAPDVLPGFNCCVADLFA